MHAREKSRRGGFTLIETMIALTLLGIGLLSLSTMQIVAMKHGNRGRHTTQAAVIAQTRMEQLQRMRWTSIAPTAGWTAAVAVNNVVQDGGNKLEQAYNRSERITDEVAGATRTIDVRVNWSEPGRPNRQYAISSIRFNFEGL
jgi:prepilin-type N-terminal cleavage/methylation domain-containing protein